MSFDMKYDRDGMPLPVKPVAVIEEPVVPVQQEVEYAAEDLSQDVAQVEEVETPIEQPKVSRIDDKEQNLRTLREAAKRADRLEWERDDALRRLQEAENNRVQKQAIPEPENDDLGLGDTDLAEGKHLSKVARKIKELEKKVQQYEQNTATQVTEARLRTQFADYDKVVSRENIKLLEQQYPEIANTLNSSTDLYSTAVSAYTMIKKLGIIPQEVYNPEKAQALRNLSKPRPLASLSPQQGDSPLSKANAFANGLTEDLKKQLAREMFEARNQI